MSDVLVDAGLCGAVAEPAGRNKCGTLHGRQLAPVTLALEEGLECTRKLPRVDVETRLGRLPYSREQDLVLGREPCQCLLLVRDVLWPGFRVWHVEGDRVTVRVELLAGCVGGVQVVVDSPADGCVASDVPLRLTRVTGM